MQEYAKEKEMDIDKMLAEAKAAPEVKKLEEYAEAITVLREKNYSWRDIADFLNKRGVDTDHTRVYRLFNKTNEKKNVRRFPLEVLSARFVGEKQSKKKTATFKIFEFSLPSTLGKPIKALGFIWDGDTINAKYEDGNLAIEKAEFVIKKPQHLTTTSYLLLTIQTLDDSTKQLKVYFQPAWEEILLLGKEE